jgi:ABC-2 type transport system permease protein
MSIRYISQRYRYSFILLRQLVKTDFKLRYQGSVLGYAWSLLKPLMMFAILYLVFTVFLPVGKGVPHYPVYLLLGIVLWNYFSEVTNGSVDAIVGKGELLRKINFPKYIIILAGSFSALINLALNGVVIVVFMFLGRVPLSWHVVLLVPLILELFVAALAVAFFLSALYVRFRDVKHIWDVIMQGAFYATPILYPLSRIPHRAAVLLILNPMAQIIQDARHVLVTPTATTIGDLYGTAWAWAIPVGLVALVALTASLYFRTRSRYFAEEV